MNKKRVSLHNGKRSQKTGRIIKPPHNDTDRRKNENVKAEWVERNNYYKCYDGEYSLETQDGKMSFEKSELRYYNEHFAAALKVQNEKHISARQKRRIKKMEDWLASPRYAPSESILRVGNVDDGFADAKTLKSITDEYLTLLRDWSAAHNNCLFVLNYALHADEYYTDEDTGKDKMSSPHVHLRYVWQYTDSNGNLTVGEEKALEQAGVELPDPSKKPGRYNNRIMTFTAEFRKELQKIVKEHGYDVEIEPLPTKRKAKDRETFVAEKRAAKEIEKALEMQQKAQEDSKLATRLQLEAIRMQRKANEQKIKNEADAEYNEKVRRKNEDKEAGLIEKKEKLEAEKADFESRREYLEKMITEVTSMRGRLIKGIEENDRLTALINDVRAKEKLTNRNNINKNRFSDPELDKMVESIKRKMSDFEKR